jgi:formylglycine-generating enzyme required for sulfatase activity
MKQFVCSGRTARFRAVFLLAAFAFAACSMGGGSVYVGGTDSSGASGDPAPTPSVPNALPADFAYVPGGTVTGSASYAMTVTVPNNPVYTNPGTTSTHSGVFVAGRTIVIAPFSMAKYETTRALWYEVQTWAAGKGYTFGHTISSAANPNRPVTGIDWRDAVVWCNAYSEKEGRDPVYRSGGAVIKSSRSANAAAVDGAQMDKTKNGFRLPTEAEREYAARGGDPSAADWMYAYAGSNDPDAVAWHHGNSPRALRDTGGKAPNRLGIYDLSGNAQEWGWDWMHYATNVTAATPADGAAYSAGFSQKPMAGGGVGSNVTYSCVALRWSWITGYTSPYVGFRVVCGSN